NTPPAPELYVSSYTRVNISDCWPLGSKTELRYFWRLCTPHHNNGRGESPIYPGVPIPLGLFCFLQWQNCTRNKQRKLPWLSKRREEEVAKEAEYEEADNPVDGVYVDDDHVHVKTPASRVLFKVQIAQLVASSVGELASNNGTRLPLEACFGRQTGHFIWWY
uniref:Uncharacterized protein n=1 Tax=Gasterosteus aculeatus TaxID=69293 RepID=G3NV11_GASAC